MLSVDEKSQIQALDRTQPILPLRPGLPERQTHDYKRHGTTTLFAALNVLEGTVIGECQPRHRHQEFLLFLERIDKSIDAQLTRDARLVAEKVIGIELRIAAESRKPCRAMHLFPAW